MYIIFPNVSRHLTQNPYNPYIKSKKKKRVSYRATNVDKITQVIMHRGSGRLTQARQLSAAFSITVVPSQNFGIPNTADRTNAPLYPSRFFFFFLFC